MAKAKRPPKPRDTAARPSGQPAQPGQKSYAVRETIESIVIAFVLAFLFRTFQAEAFVIPTGSMAPTLMGRHKDVFCPQCDYRFQVSASEEEDRQRVPAKTLSGRCPMCRYVLPMEPELPLPDGRFTDVPYQPSYNGDRILVNKFLYTIREPERWDVVVFKFPGDANMNYIKRLVGLPGERLRIYQGNLFVGGEQPPGGDFDDFQIARKPPDKILALRQLVHDTDHDPAELDAVGWPLRWHDHTADDAGWQLNKTIERGRVRQRYHVDRQANGVAWLRYEHVVPDLFAWRQVEQLEARAPDATLGFADADRSQLRKLIADANPYNARQDARVVGRSVLDIPVERQGLHWVGDLMLEADVEVAAARGELLLDLVKGGQHFTCTIDLASGAARLSADGAPHYTPAANTPLRRPGKFRVALAHVDEQLVLWVDGKVIPFDAPTGYDAEQVFGDRRAILPRTSAEDLGDLAPAGIGARGASLAVTRVRLWRDIYYIADDSRRHELRIGGLISDYQVPADVRAAFADPDRWDVFQTRRSVDFGLRAEQFFVMGDNSAESSDARLWIGDGERGGRPGGHYLERHLLIGKALCVYWPHSWHRIPGTRIPFPLFPNFQDMRLVR